MSGCSRTGAVSWAGLFALVLFGFISALPITASRAGTIRRHRLLNKLPVPQKKISNPRPAKRGSAGELAKETREAAGEEEEKEENAKLKHSAMVQWLARKVGLSVHQAHIWWRSF